MFGDITVGRNGTPSVPSCLLPTTRTPRRSRRFTRWTRALRGLVEQVYRARGGKDTGLPGAAPVSGRGRVDLRFAVDDAGELYILTKPDGMIRKVVGAKPLDLAPAGGDVGLAASRARPGHRRPRLRHAPVRLSPARRPPR